MIPVAVLTGYLGSGKTTMLRALLQRPDMADTLVVVNEFGEIGLDHQLIEAVSDGVMLLRGGCLCCSLRQDIAHTLHAADRAALSGRTPAFARVIIETSGLAEPAGVLSGLAAHPLLAGRFVARGITTLIDAEHAHNQLDRHATSRRQVACADHLVLSKTDRVTAQQVEALRPRLSAMNPLAPITTAHFGAVDPALLFAGAAATTRFAADDGSSHLDGVRSMTLVAESPLPWRSLQHLIAMLLEECGASLLRLKGVVDVQGQSQPVVLHAIGDTFYPVEVLPAWPAGERRSVLVVIVEGDGSILSSLHVHFAAWFRSLNVRL